MKKIPNLIRTRFKKDARVKMVPNVEMPKSTGIYLEKGDFIGAHDSKSFLLPEGTIIINGHYKKKDDENFTQFDEEDYIASHNEGWSLTAVGDDSSIVCTFYTGEDISIIQSSATAVSTLTEYPETLNNTITYTNWSKQFPRVSQAECLTLSHAYKTSSSMDFAFPKDYHLVVVKGPAIINEQPKTFKTWIHSSQNQIVNLKSQNGDEVLVFLLY